MRKREIYEKIKLPRELDRRVKLLPDDRERIKQLYKDGMSIHGIAREYKGKCSKRSIQFVLFPERLKALQDKHRKEQHWKTFFNRKQLTECVRNLRHYKKDLFEKGKLKENGK